MYSYAAVYTNKPKSKAKRCAIGILCTLVFGLTLTCNLPSASSSSEQSYVLARASTSKVFINGKAQFLSAYNINNYNYFKLRDVANALIGTSSSFNIAWDPENKIIDLISKQNYQSDLAPIEYEELPECYATSSYDIVVRLDNEPVMLEAYNISGFNYFKLRDVASIIDFSVDYDEPTDAILITVDDLLNPIEPYNDYGVSLVNRRAKAIVTSPTPKPQNPTSSSETTPKDGNTITAEINNSVSNTATGGSSSGFSGTGQLSPSYYYPIYQNPEYVNNHNDEPMQTNPGNEYIAPDIPRALPRDYYEPAKGIAEIAPPWDRRSIIQKYALVNWNNNTYKLHAGKISDSIVEGFIGSGVLIGNNEPYDNKIRSTTCEVYSIKSLPMEFAVAIKYDGYKGYFLFSNRQYNPSSLNELIDGVSLTNQNNYLESVYHFTHSEQRTDRSEHFNKDIAVIWSILFKDEHLQYSPTSRDYNTKILIYLSINAFGDPSLCFPITVWDNGMIVFNAFGISQTYAYDLDVISALSDYVLAESS